MAVAYDWLDTHEARATRRRWRVRLLIAASCVLAAGSVGALIARTATVVPDPICPTAATIAPQVGPEPVGDLRSTCYAAAAHDRDDAKTRRVELLVLAFMCAGGAGACELSRRRSTPDNDVVDSLNAAASGGSA